MKEIHTTTKRLATTDVTAFYYTLYFQFHVNVYITES